MSDTTKNEQFELAPSLQFTINEACAKRIAAGKMTPEVPYDSIKLRFGNGELQLQFNKKGKTMLTVDLPEGWERAESFEICGVNGNVKVGIY